MGTMQSELSRAGFKLSEEEQKKMRESLTAMKRKSKTSTCRKCGEQILFKESSEGRVIPHDLDGIPHWQTCPYSAWVHKKASPDIMKKLTVLFLTKYGADLEAEAGLTKKEVLITQAVLEKIFKEDANPVKKKVEEDDGKVDSDVQFKPEPCDSVGDPDEERAPDEELVHEAEEKITEAKDLDKGVEKAISEPIVGPEATAIPEGTPVCEEK